MRPLRYSINVTLDGCCDHREGIADEDLHRHAAENIAQADALLFGRVTYEMMEAAWRLPTTGARPDWMTDWMDPFARTIDAARKYVVSSALDRVDWNAELVRGDLESAVRQLKQAPGKGLLAGGVKLPLALAELGLIDEYELVVHPRLAGHGPNVVRGAIEACRIEAREPAGAQLRSGGDAVRAEKVAIGLALTAGGLRCCASDRTLGHARTQRRHPLLPRRHGFASGLRSEARHDFIPKLGCRGGPGAIHSRRPAAS